MKGQPNLLEMVLAFHSPGGFAGGLHSGQKRRDEHADDGDDDQQLNKRECDATTNSNV